MNQEPELQALALRHHTVTDRFAIMCGEQLKAGNPDATAWEKNKGGGLNLKRSEKAEARIYQEKLAKKAKAAKK